MECSICFEPLSNGAFSTHCGHIFCECINKYIVTTSACCPICNQTLTAAQIHKIFLPNNRDSCGNSSNGGDIALSNAIVQSLIHDLEQEKKNTQHKFSEMQKLLDHLTILFSKVDSRHYELADANKQILADLKVLKLERESNSNSGDKGLVDLFAESSSENE